MMGGPTNSGKSSLVNALFTGKALFNWKDKDRIEVFPESLNAETYAFWTIQTSDVYSLKYQDQDA
jgi:predicted GTPase